MIYYDNIFVIGYGRSHIHQQTASLLAALQEEEALVSPKSTLEPRLDI